MKTTIESHGYEIVIEETESGLTVSAMKDDEVVESFELEVEGGEDEFDDQEGGDDFDEEGDFDDDQLEDDELQTKPQSKGQAQPQSKGQAQPQSAPQVVPQAQKEEQKLESLTFDKFLSLQNKTKPTKKVKR